MALSRYYVDNAGCVRDSVLDLSVHERDSELSDVEIAERLNKGEALNSRLNEGAKRRAGETRCGDCPCKWGECATAEHRDALRAQLDVALDECRDLSAELDKLRGKLAAYEDAPSVWIMTENVFGGEYQYLGGDHYEAGPNRSRERYIRAPQQEEDDGTAE